MISDIRQAFRSLMKSRGFTAIAILTLALGIGVNTAMFSMLNGFLLRPLSYPHVEQLFRLLRSTPQQPQGNQTAANFIDIKRDSADFADLAGYRYWGFTLTEPGKAPDMPFSLRVSANYFDVLGVRMALGRGFVPAEDAPGANNVVVISHDYWQKRFEGDPGIIGRTVRIDDAPVQIVGVMRASEDESRLTGPVQLYRPMAFSEGERADRTGSSIFVIGRYREGTTSGQADGRFREIAGRLAADFPAENGGMGLHTRTLQSMTLTGVGLTMTWLLVGLAGFVLLIACANLANLLLARAIERGHEFSIRGALGASSVHLIRPLAAECVIIATFGCVASLFVATWTSDWLAVRFGDPGSPMDFSLDSRVLVFAMAVSVLTTILFGTAPAWWATRVGINESLKGSARGSTGTRAQFRYRQSLIIVQFAVALVLLAGAGFFMRGIGRLTRVESGWNPSGVVTGSVNLASAKYNSAEPIIAFHNELRRRLMELPGVANVAVGFEEPLYDAPAERSYLVEGREPPEKGHEPVANTNGVSASYLDTFGMHLLRGRFIDETDTLTSRPVVVINESMANALFPHGDPVGSRIAVVGGDKPVWSEIVGVIEDVRSPRVRPSPISFQVYKPFTQESWQYAMIAVRASDPAIVPSLFEPIRRTVAALDPNQPVVNMMSDNDRLDRNAGVWRTIDQILIMFASLGLLLSALGVYGVTSRLVAQRTTEIGIRMALGAQVRDIMQLMLTGSLRVVLIGAAIGLLGSLYLAHYLTVELPAFGGSSLVPVTTGAALLVIVALAACWLPARRATKVDPMTALRAE